MATADMYTQLFAANKMKWNYQSRLIGQNGLCFILPLGSIPDPLLFLVYINDLSKSFQCKAKLLDDNYSILSVVHDPVA